MLEVQAQEVGDRIQYVPALLIPPTFGPNVPIPPPLAILPHPITSLPHPAPSFLWPLPWPYLLWCASLFML